MSRRNRRLAAKQRKWQQQFEKGVQRTAAFRDGDTTTVIRHPTKRGYDVPMVRDFLEHLLAELRVQQWENLTSLRALDKTGDMELAVKAPEVPSEVIKQILGTFIQKYESCLVPATVIDGSNASREEAADCMRAYFRANIERRDLEIGHLEALQGLFDEALQCAKLPFGFDKDGNPVQPYSVISVREYLTS